MDLASPLRSEPASRGLTRALLISSLTLACLPTAGLLSSCGGAAGANPQWVRSERAPLPGSDEQVQWREFGPEAFAEARQSGRLIMLSVQADWCHFCHVMNEQTFGNDEVLALLGREFIAIRADGDARPDLAERYLHYAWPATVILTPDGEEILGIRGYKPPDAFIRTLHRTLAAHQSGTTLLPERDAEPEPSELSEVRDRLTAQLDDLYDQEQDGWGRRQRYPFAAPVEHALFRSAERGEEPWRARALQSLERYASLIDPIFGGMYQYSVGGVWDQPHFEKIVPIQAGAMSTFAEAYRMTGDRRWLGYAESIHRYVREFLTSPTGAFYTSQDADLGGHGQSGPALAGAEYYALPEAERRELGIPRIDTHIYASNTGMLIDALARLSVANHRAGPLREATEAMVALNRSHKTESGLFQHGLEERAGQESPEAGDRSRSILYLADQAHVLTALISLHQATGDERWLAQAQSLADAVLQQLREGGEGAFLAHTIDPDAQGIFRQRRSPIAENGVMARALLRLSRLADEERYGDAARQALASAANGAELRGLGRMVGQYLLALEWAESPQVLLSVVGPADSAETDALFRAAQSFYHPTRLVERHVPGEGRYPYPGQPAVYMCTHDSCSMPITDPAELANSVNAFLQH